MQSEEREEKRSGKTRQRGQTRRHYTTTRRGKEREGSSGGERLECVKKKKDAIKLKFSPRVSINFCSTSLPTRVE